MKSTLAALRSHKQLRVMGFDDSPFSKSEDERVNIAGVVCSNTRFEGMVFGDVQRDGRDATEVVYRLLTQSKFYSQLHALLFDGIAFGGFNLIDLKGLAQSTQLPCIAVMRKSPDLTAIDRVLQKFDDYERRKALVESAGEISKHSHFVYQAAGLDAEPAGQLLERTTDRGKVPEALRIAHLIGSAVKRGESGKRA